MSPVCAPPIGSRCGDGVTTIAALAGLDHEVAGVDDARRDTMRPPGPTPGGGPRRPDDPPPFELLAAPAASWTRPDEPIGFAALPEPDDGDVFLDFEGHPFWQADVGLFFLFGLIEQRRRAVGVPGVLGARPGGGGRSDQALVDYLAARRERFPDMHVYHYNHTERSSLQRLASEHGVAELESSR